MTFKEFDKVWVIINNNSYPGIVVEVMENMYRVLRYYDGIYTTLYLQESSLRHRDLNISYDIFTNRIHLNERR